MPEKLQQLRFTGRVEASDFASALTERIDAYFKEHGISRHANAEMYFKTFLGFSSWILIYCLIMTDWFSPIQVIGLFFVFGWTQLFIAFNIAHDANHRGYSANQKVNKTLSCAFDLVGGSSYMWRLMHNDAHHGFTNIPGTDSAITAHNILRFSPYAKRFAFHRYQHIYVSFVYALATLDWVLVKDYYWFFFKKKYGNRWIEKQPRKELVFLLVTKAFYYTYMLVLPIMFLSVPAWAVLLGFVAMHFFTGFTIALIFQPTHVTRGTVFRLPDAEGQIDRDHVTHIFETTADYARGNPLACWILGSLNLHVIHHMFPQICHVHYPALTRIVKSTAEEYGLKYREYKTVAGAYFAHLGVLKDLGHIDNPFATGQQAGPVPASAG